MTTRNPLANARGLGSAKEGVKHWWIQRLTAIVMIPLLLWFIVSFVSIMVGTSRLEVQNWFASPVNTFLLLALLTAAFWHAKLGLQVVIEDYIHKNPWKMLSIIKINLVYPIAILMSWVAVLKLHIVGL